MKIKRYFLSTLLFFGGGCVISAKIFAQTNQEFIVLLVDKDSLKAELRTLPSDPKQSRFIHSFEVAIGQKDGDKENEGDLKTPEGIYFSENFINTAKMPQNKYGKMAIPLDFPNPIDKIAGKSGSGIWLHGAGDDERMTKKKTTEGCVAFYNKDLISLLPWLEPLKSAVVIGHRFSEINSPKDVELAKQSVENWISSWQQRDFPSYIKHYNAKMQINGKELASFSAFKKRVFASYKQIELQMSDLHFITHPKYAVAFMNQYFQGDSRFISQGRKILYLEKLEDRYEIVAEKFAKRPFGRLDFSDIDLAKLNSSFKGNI